MTPQPFSIRPFRRFPVHCSVTYNAGPFLTLPRGLHWPLLTHITWLPFD
jgi:hypothetical protein